MKKRFFGGVIIFTLFALVVVSLPALAATNASELIAVDNEEVISIAEKNEEEPTSNFNKIGTLLEIGSTDVPTELILRVDDVDYTVEIDENTILGQKRDQLTKLEHWIPGDNIRVVGIQNDNTGVVTADVVVNRSIVLLRHTGFNGWIKEIDTANNQITAEWRGEMHTIQITDNTRINARFKNPGTIDDLKVEDRIRARLIKRSGLDIPEANIIIVLRHGKTLFMKVRTWSTPVELVSLEGTEAPATMQVKILRSPKLREGDVNNLIGQAGDIKTINVKENTVLVRRYFGRTTLDEFTPGDSLRIVGRINDDGTVDAKLIKDNFIWLTSTKGRRGIVTKVDTDNNYLNIRWLGKKYRVDISDNTAIKDLTLDGEHNASISDIKRGDFIRGYGVKHAKLPLVSAKTIVVVPKLKAAKKVKVLQELQSAKIQIGEIKSIGE